MTEVIGHHAQCAMAFIADELMLELMREQGHLHQQQTRYQQKGRCSVPIEPQLHVKMADPLLHCV